MPLRSRTPLWAAEAALVPDTCLRSSVPAVSSEADSDFSDEDEDEEEDEEEDVPSLPSLTMKPFRSLPSSGVALGVLAGDGVAGALAA